MLSPKLPAIRRHNAMTPRRPCWQVLFFFFSPRWNKLIFFHLPAYDQHNWATDTEQDDTEDGDDEGLDPETDQLRENIEVGKKVRPNAFRFYPKNLELKKNRKLKTCSIH